MLLDSREKRFILSCMVGCLGLFQLYSFYVDRKIDKIQHKHWQELEESREAYREQREELRILKDIRDKKQRGYVVVYNEDNIGLPKESWKDDFPGDYSTGGEPILGAHTSTITKRLGESYIKIMDSIKISTERREVWIYVSDLDEKGYGEKALYLYIDKSKLVSYRLGGYRRLVDEMASTYLDEIRELGW